MLWLKAIWHGAKEVATYLMSIALLFVCVAGISMLIGSICLTIGRWLDGLFGAGWWNVPVIVIIGVLTIVAIAATVLEATIWVRDEHNRLARGK